MATLSDKSCTIEICSICHKHHNWSERECYKNIRFTRNYDSLSNTPNNTETQDNWNFVSKTDDDEFLDYVSKTINKCYEILQQAKQEYASDDERFSNFIRTANELKRNPRLKNIKGQDIGIIFLKKHLDSIFSGISLREDMQGRIVDAINYLLLIGEMIERDI